jgi:hypothetical protein
MRALIAAAALCVAGCATQSSAPQPPAPGALPTDTHRVLPPHVGWNVFRFRAERSGKVTLVFEYGPFDMAAPATKVVRYEISVE